jgi:hypothetical protein
VTNDQFTKTQTRDKHREKLRGQGVFLQVSQHTSSIIEALRTGAGKGRLSTLEAMALLLHVLPPDSAADTTQEEEEEEEEEEEASNVAAAAAAAAASGFQPALAGLRLLVAFVEAQNTLYAVRKTVPFFQGSLSENDDLPRQARDKQTNR